MKDQRFMDIVELTHHDMRILENDVVGVVVITVARSDTNNMTIKVGATVPPIVIAHALILAGNRLDEMQRVKPTTLRKAV